MPHPTFAVFQRCVPSKETAANEYTFRWPIWRRDWKSGQHRRRIWLSSNTLSMIVSRGKRSGRRNEKLVPGQFPACRETPAATGPNNCPVEEHDRLL